MSSCAVHGAFDATRTGAGFAMSLACRAQANRLTAATSAKRWIFLPWRRWCERDGRGVRPPRTRRPARTATRYAPPASRSSSAGRATWRGSCLPSAPPIARSSLRTAPWIAWWAVRARSLMTIGSSPASRASSVQWISSVLLLAGLFAVAEGLGHHRLQVVRHGLAPIGMGIRVQENLHGQRAPLWSFWPLFLCRPATSLSSAFSRGRLASPLGPGWAGPGSYSRALPAGQ